MKMKTPESTRRPYDFLSVRGHSMIVCTDATGPRSFGAISAIEPERLNKLDAYLDSLDAAHEDADGNLATA